MDPRQIAELRSKALRGIAWKAGSRVFAQVARIAVAVVLARLLTPDDYGLAAMVLAFSSLVLIFSDLALGAALVQRKELSEEDRSTVFWFGAASGVVFTVLGVAASWPVAAFYGEPDVQPLFAALSLSFLVTALGTTQTALLTREMSFRSLELRIMAGTAVGGVVGITVALQGGGAWALIAQQIAHTTVSTVLLWRFSAWKPRLLFSMASLRAFGTFSANVLGTRLLFYLNRNADNILIGRFLGSAALGAYALAYNVMLIPFSRLAEPVQEVLFPVFARLQDDARRVADAWIRVNRVIGALSIPALLGLMAVATDFVAVVLGGRWADAAPVIQILAWVGLMQSLQRLNSSILEARNRTSWLLGYSVVVLVGSLVAFAVGLHWGILGVATAYAVSSTLIEPFYTWLTARALGVPVLPFFRALAGVAQAALVMLVAVVAARHALLGTGLGPAARLGLCILVGVAVYVPLCAWRAPEVLRDLKGLRRRPPEAPRVTAQPEIAT